MTQILIDIRRPNEAGELVNVYGEIEWYPSRRSGISDAIIEANGFILKLEGSPITVNVVPNTEQFCWAVVERTEDTHGETSLYRRYVTVPDTNNQLNYVDLTDVNPSNFEPTIVPISPLAGMVVTGEVVDNDLILTTYDGTDINAGVVVGATGATGAAGVDGIDGDTGPAGLSAYEIAVNQGFEGTEQQWLDYLNGTAAIEAHISDVTPHPAYDDASSLNLLFENGLV